MEDTTRPDLRRRRSSNGTKSRERRQSNEKFTSPGLDRRNSSGGTPMQRRRSSLGPVQEEQPLLDDDEELMSSSMDEYTSSEVAGTRQSRNASDNDAHDESFSGPLHYLPLVVAVVPPLGAVLHGRAEAWTDALILLLVAFYLYQIVRVPWEIYYASRTRRINLAMTVLGNGADEDEIPESIIRRRKAAQSELYQQELLSLVFCVASPFIGSYLLYWVKGALSEPDRYINPFNIRLFVLGSGVKPLSHLFRLLKSRSIFLQSEVHYPVPTVASLLKRVSRLETELDDLRKGYATKSDVKMLRDGVDAPLTQLSKALKRSERKEEYLRLSSEEKFALMTERQEEMLNEIAVSAHLIEQLRVEQHRSGSVLRVMRHIFSGERPAEESRQASSYLWYERGPFFYLFLPIIASNRMLDATGRLFGSLHLRVSATERSGMIEGRNE